MTYKTAVDYFLEHDLGRIPHRHNQDVIALQKNTNVSGTAVRIGGLYHIQKRWGQTRRRWMAILVKRTLQHYQLLQLADFRQNEAISIEVSTEG